MPETKVSSSSSGGIGFVGLLTILFVALKLTNFIDWSWWWVLSPLWIPVAILFGMIAARVIIALWPRRKHRRWES
ncbi:hypothetical protein LCGC14_2519900 [marine sediment metagenome]|uniref:Transmembrane Fragile-X-F protein n=1 Tax=marine sediment metagenome TaxID=412755 RepID=A0A0F9BJN8_9ZZZZ